MFYLLFQRFFLYYDQYRIVSLLWECRGRDNLLKNRIILKSSLCAATFSNQL